MLDQVAPDPRAFKTVQAYRAPRALEIESLRAAFADVVARHEALRTVVETHGGEPRARVLSRPPVAIELDDLTGLPRERREDAARRALANEAARRLDLRTGPLMRLRVVRVADDDHLLVLAAHDACADADSLAVLWRELELAYAARRAGRPPGLPAPPAQYRDHARRQRERLAAGELDPALAFWSDRLRGLQPLALPSDRPRPLAASYRSAEVVASLRPDVRDAVRALAARNGATTFAVLLAGIEVVLARYTGQTDVGVGTDVRAVEDPAGLVGPCANAVALRTDVSGDPPFAELLARVQRTTREAWEHGDAPFEKVVEALQRTPDTSRHPLFQVALHVARPGAPPVFEGAAAEPVEVDPVAHPLDLTLEAVDSASDLELRVRYATDLFDRPRIARLVGHLQEVLAGAAADETLRLSQLPLLATEERRLLLEAWQGEECEQPRVPVHAQVAARAAAQPDAIAAQLGEQQLSYGELVRRAGALARRLRELGVGREDVVAVALPPGPELVVALLGTLCAGGAFVVLDTTHPPRRLEFILGDAAARVVVTESRLLERLPSPDGWTAVCVDREQAALEALADGPELAEQAGEEALAYLLYTSGSTGQPKGVLVEHHALTTFLLWLGGLFGLGRDDRVLQHMALVFDFAVGEIFTALTAGATLVFVPEDERRSPAAIGELLERERITYLGGTPAVLGAIPRRAYPDLRGMVVGGEAFSAELVDRWNVPPRRFVNGYGPTEAAVGCIFYECEHRPWTGPPPIGRAMPRRYAYVLDPHDNLCPVGVPGEIVVGGAGIARGYLNAPEATAERFGDDPFHRGGRIYRTGDLGVWSEDGQIEFLGRIDSQVKLNGLRIELEEIESALGRDPEVAAAAVAVHELAGAKQLVGYLVPADGEVDASAVRARLADELPPYMIPSRFLTLDALPLTPVGKIDRAALPAPVQMGAATRRYAAPRTPAEELVCDVFARVLKLDRVGAEADFFALGGTSLDAARAVQELRAATARDVPLRLLYTRSTVALLAEALEAESSAA